MGAGQHDVDPLAVQRKLVLDEHLHIAKAGVDQILRNGWQAPRPRTPLGLSHAVPTEPHLFPDPVGQRAVGIDGEQASRGRAECRH
jgi:hypothetical protein